MKVTTINGLKTATTHTLPFPRLNEPAPDFEVKTTHGTKKLSDYRGRYLVLFSRPADFTPVCTTEFVAFAQHHEAFQKVIVPPPTTAEEAEQRVREAGLHASL